MHILARMFTPARIILRQKELVGPMGPMGPTGPWAPWARGLHGPMGPIGPWAHGPIISYYIIK